MDRQTASDNATVVAVRRVHESLMIFRVVPDVPDVQFQAGQYTTLGLCEVSSESGSGPVSPRAAITRRAYSYSCSMLDDEGALRRAQDFPYLEFYIARIEADDPARHPLTPQLFDLEVGDRLHIGRKATGHYTLHGVQPHEDVVFAATGTGEAPHNAMLAELLTRGHQGRIVAVTCARNLIDLAYLTEHRQIESRYANYRYLALTTREPENVDASNPGFIGRRYLQEYFQSGLFEQHAAITLDPTRVHVYLCGNPGMIGAPSRDGSLPSQLGMTQILLDRGYTLPSATAASRLHFEKYW